jgi:hypothetical protein
VKNVAVRPQRLVYGRPIIARQPAAPSDAQSLPLKLNNFFHVAPPEHIPALLLIQNQARLATAQDGRFFNRNYADFCTGADSWLMASTIKPAKTRAG